MVLVNTAVIIGEILVIAFLFMCVLVIGCFSNWTSWRKYCKPSIAMRKLINFLCYKSKSLDAEAPAQSEISVQSNPIIIGLVSHLREHHSSSRNSAAACAGCSSFQDLPPKYDEMFAAAASVEEESPPPSYDECVSIYFDEKTSIMNVPEMNEFKYTQSCSNSGVC